MKKLSISAFTLTELIVVITILAILWTLWFISYGGFVQSARNSQRVSDLKIIERSLSLFITTNNVFPLPDEPIPISYSGSLAWTQGVFWEWVRSQIQRISNTPTDPSYNSKYTYSVLNNRQKYTIGTLREQGLFSKNGWIVSQSYAFSSDGLITFLLWNHLAYDVALISANNCSIITSPSIILSDIPAGWELIDGDFYNYSYFDWPNLPNSYSGAINLSYASTDSFQVFEILNSCTISSVAELKLYIAKLATAYQPMASSKKYEALVFLSNTKQFQITAVDILTEHGISVAPEVLNELNSPNFSETFIDTFTDTAWTELVGGHSPDNTIWSWTYESGSAWDYTIENNRVQKNNASASFIYPTTIPSIASANYTMTLDVENFWTSEISLYLRYTDSDNYYRINISPLWYVLVRRQAGVDSIFQNINDPIANGSTITFWVQDDSVNFAVNGIEKENILAGWITDIWKPLIFIQSSGAQIDNFTLNYK